VLGSEGKHLGGETIIGSFCARKARGKKTARLSTGSIREGDQETSSGNHLGGTGGWKMGLPNTIKERKSKRASQGGLHRQG